MIVRYTELPDEAGGSPRPLLDLTIGDMDDIFVPSLVDSGALHTLLPRWVADAAGLAVVEARTVVLGVGARSTSAAFTTVRLSAADNVWEADVGFCDPWPYAWGLLGQRSFFRYFTVTFRAADYEFEVEPLSA